MQATSQAMNAAAQTGASAAKGKGSRKTYARWIGAAFLVGFQPAALEKGTSASMVADRLGAGQAPAPAVAS